ncbi:MAG: neutral amino acid transport system permease protein [Natronomonas sp.]|jgi:neutral amino acid transport system permease protein
MEVNCMVSAGLLDAIATGLVTGSIIAAGALGLSLIYSIAEVPNFAHGDMITIGAYLALVFNKPGAIPFLPDQVPVVGSTSLWVAGIIAIGLAAVFSAGYELAVFRQFRRKDADLITMVIVSLGLALVLRNTVLFLAGSKNISYATEPVRDVFWDGYLTSSGITIQLTQRQAGDVVVLDQWGYAWWLVAVILLASVAVGVAVYRSRTTSGDFDVVHLVDPRVLAVGAGLATLLALAALLRFGDGTVADPLASTRVGTSWKDGTVVVLTALAMFVLNVLLKTTRLGKAMRATADNLDLAEVRGVDVDRVQLVVWVVAGLLAALAGILAGWSASNINPNMGFTLLLPVFAAVIMGGIRSPYGSALAGLIIGLSMDLGVFFLPPSLAVYREAIAFVILIAVLLVKPEGIWGDV